MCAGLMRLEKRILIVDDDDAIRALVVTVLRRRGYRLDTARNGLEALEKLKNCRYSLVVLDLMMPRMSGYDVLDTLA
ncbi:MAG TPA: response regulator, partial [Haliangium sp.]|nr:response regulator [Haliangium sp.]